MTIADRKNEGSGYGRSLENYKSMHTKTAENKGCKEEFLACKTLTQARKVLFGMKKGQTKSKGQK